jgi:outer membrane protein assembly factor BamB
VAVTTFDGRLIGLDAASGERRWSYAAAAPVLMLRATSAPKLYEEAVVAGFANGRVVAVSRSNGQLFWEARAGVSTGVSEIERLADVAGDMLIDDGTLYVVAYQGELSAIDVRSGRRLWARPASSYVGLDEGFSNIYVASAEGSVVAFDSNNQGVRWEQSALARRELSGPAVIGNYVAVGDLEGYVHLLAQADGRIAARTRVDRDGVRVAPLVVDDLLYVYGNGGKLVAYRLEAKQ